MRRALAALGAVVLTASACTGAGTLPAPRISGVGFGTDAKGTVELWVRAATQAASAPIVAAFNKTHKDLQVHLTAIPDAQYVTKLATAIRGRAVPDVVDIDDINSTLLAYHEALTDITPLVDSLPFKKELSPAHLNLATYHGRHYAVPYAADISVLYYNKTLFRRAHIAKPPTTLDQVLDRRAGRSRSWAVASRVSASAATPQASSASPRSRRCGRARTICSPAISPTSGRTWRAIPRCGRC